MTAIGVAGVVSAIRAIRVPQVRQTPPTSAAARLSPWPSSSTPSASSSSAVGSSFADDRRGDEPERDHGGAGAEPAGLRDVVGEPEAPAVRGSEELERAHAEMVAIDGAVAGGELELVPELERGAGAIEAGAEVGGRGRGADADDHRVRPRRDP